MCDKMKIEVQNKKGKCLLKASFYKEKKKERKKNLDIVLRRRHSDDTPYRSHLISQKVD